MAAASSNPVPQPNYSPRSAVETSAALSGSPRSSRASTPRGGQSSWTHIVRGGGDSDFVVSSSSVYSVSPVQVHSPSSAEVQEQILNSASALASSSSAMVSSLPDDFTGHAQPDGSENVSAIINAAKKSAWSKPSDGAAEVGSLMGAESWPALSESWPALSESTKPSSKSSSSDLLKAPSERLESLSQGAGIASSSPRKQVMSNNTNTNTSPNHVGPTRQRSMKRGGGSSSNSVSANGGFPQPSHPPPQGAVVEMGYSLGKTGNAAEESSSRDHTHKEGGQKGGFGGQLHGGNDHQPQQRNSFRRGNGGPHHRLDGSHHHHNYGGRRDQDRGNQDWNPQRNFGGRDNHMLQQRVSPRGFMLPATHNSAPFMPPSVPVRPFGNAMLYPELASPVIFVPGPPVNSLRGVPMVAPIPPSHAIFFPLPDPQLLAKIDPQLYAMIVHQIDYYFSNENLIKDTFLRQNMDGQGWVSIELIAGFKKVMQLTDNIQLILDALQTSTVVEVQGDKVRKLNDWMKWIMPSHVQFSTVPSPQSLRSGHDMLEAHLHSISLDEDARTGLSEAYLSRSLSGEYNNQLQQSHYNIQADEHSSFTGSSSR